MGNTNNTPAGQKSTKEFLRELKTQLDVEQAVKDPRFGNIKICRHKSNPKIRVFMMTKTPTEEEFERLALEISERQINHPNLLTIYGFDKESSGVCSSNGKATIFVEWQKHNLEKEIERRAEKQVFLEKNLLF